MKNYDEIYKDYMAHFSHVCETLLIYNENDFNKSCCFYKEEIERHFNNYIAYKNMATGEITAMDGTLEVPVDKKNFRSNKKCRLKAHAIYLAEVRRSISDEPSFGRTNTLQLVNILKKNVKDDELTRAAKEALAPFELKIDGLGTFTWTRNYSCSSFDGEVKWGNDTIDVELEPDGTGLKTANKALQALKKAYQKQEELTENIFTALAEECMNKDGTITIWDEDESSLSKDEFKAVCLLGIFTPPLTASLVLLSI